MRLAIQLWGILLCTINSEANSVATTVHRNLIYIENLTGKQEIHELNQMKKLAAQ